MTDVDCVKRRWQDVNRKVGVTDKATDKWWTVVRDRYSECHRHYHTLDHLNEMFQHLDSIKQHVALSRPQLISLAIFFHDIIYEPKKSDNEERSAVMFGDYAEQVGVLSETDCETVKDWILLTKSHSAGKGDNCGDEHYFLDTDMAVLGRPHTGYEEYASQIRAEYIHVPEDVYRTKRAEILEDFLTRLPLFSTQLFQKQYEEQAKSNLTGEIGRLRDNSIPV